MRLKLSDGSRELVFPDGTASQFDPAYSRDGRFIGYARSGHSVQLSLVIVDTELEKEYAFDPPGTSRSTARTPRFTPDGQRVIFTLNGPRGQQIASVGKRSEVFNRVERYQCLAMPVVRRQSSCV